MPLDEFINGVRSKVAKRYDLKTEAEIDAFFIGMEESAKDNQEALEKRDKMLRDTVAELCEAKRLLKAPVEDFARQHLEQVNSYVGEYIQNWKDEEHSSEKSVGEEHNVSHPVIKLTIDEVLDRLEYNTSQLEMELKSGLWIKGSDSEKFCYEGIVYNNQLKSWLIELKNARRLIKSTSDNCMLTWNDATMDYEWSLKEEARSLINMEDIESD